MRLYNYTITTIHAFAGILNRRAGVAMAAAFIGLFIVSNQANAQQEHQYTQYMFNTVSVNPAYAGTRDAMNLLLLSRNQWTGFEGAPKTHTFSMHTPISNYKMGVGLSVVADEIGPVRNYYINFNYAYRVQLTQKMTLSMGIKGGVYNYYAGLTDVNTGQSDPSYAQDLEKKMQPNAGAGLYLYTNKWYAGFSIPKLIQTDLDEQQSTASTWSELKRHYILMAGYVFDLNNELMLKPSFMNKIVQGAPPSTDIAAQLIYRNTFWVGASYRIGDAVAFIGNVQINKQLMVGYSYDYTTSNLNSINNGTHEIMISYDFDGFLKKKVKSPRYF